MADDVNGNNSNDGNDNDNSTMVPLYVINVRDSIENDNFEYIFNMLVDRYESFKNYPIKDVAFVNNLIVNGFRHNDVGDHVVCEYCDLEIKNWSVNENIEYVHCTMSPHCSYACKIAKHKMFNGDIIETRVIVVRKGIPRCLYKCMSNAHSRIATFADYWPVALNSMIERIAEAGLFHTKRGDETACFFCDCRVRNWNTDDDAWRRHAFENPKCFYVVSVKGEDFFETPHNNSRIDNEHVDDKRANEHNENESNEKSLQWQRRQINEHKDAKIECTICLERQRDALLLPCRHFCICVQCFFGLEQKCPTCRQDVTDFIKIFVA
ncbi:iap1 [Catopsilia pomona nucleopolyhedrovirus]|uniref:Iap1 n=1 Tax=Catopsilia pomona nucleopolyhedrovirus TaxID=1850906 RepID=A0A172WZI4_9ABAC|nr:iap1 [Catopsilia pomona nucleopolyhedrovirus]ANF29758.1 iap1 [Catopsilia pomona nucleopolyhedrovirus]